MEAGGKAYSLGLPMVSFWCAMNIRWCLRWKSLGENRMEQLL